MRSAAVLLMALVLLGCGYGPGYRMGMASTAAPAISMVSPNTWAAGGSAFALTVNGTNFSPGASIYWNGIAHGTMFVTGNQLVTTITASDVMTAGTFPVYVRSQGLSSNTVTFKVQ
ncbi:MAG TPA: IPT/TIG domain-containing protein [Terriglobales bacterium]|nr:IPT/TIG domain-containing protein [Terriglobales bacterium]